MSTPTREAAARRPRSRFWTAIGASVGVLVVGGLAVLAYAQYSARSRLQQAIAEADRDDPHWMLGELESQRRRVAPEENSALRVLDVLRGLQGWTSAPGVPIEATTDRPRGDALHQAVSKTESDAALPPELRAAVREELAGRGEAIAAARSLADLGEGRATIQYAPVVVNTRLDATQNCRIVARLLQLDAIDRAESGDIDGALDSCRAILGVARSIGDEPFEISQLVRIAVDSVGLATIERVLAQGVPSDRALERLERDLAKEAETPFALVGLKGERAASFEMMQLLRSGQISAGGAGLAKSSLLGSVVQIGSLGTSNQAFLLSMMNRAVAICRRPIREQAGLWSAWEADNAPKDGFARWTNMLAYSLLPAVRAGAEAGLRARAQIQAARLMIAVERFRIAEGRWPDRVEQLSPRYFARIPEDVYDDKLVKLALREDGRTAYVVGPDRTDDGGWRDPRNRPAFGTDLGYRLLDPGLRHRSTPELPDNLFRTDGPGVGDDVPRDREGRRRRPRHPEIPPDASPGGDR